MEKLLTIAIPVFERFDFFPDAFNSALKQTVPCTVLVVDNASKHSLFHDYCKSYGNENTIYVRNDKNLGMIENWNRCIELCTTKYITILHDDDILHHQFAEYVLSKLGIQCDAISVGCFVGEKIPDSFRENTDVNYQKINQINNKCFYLGNLIPFPGVVFPKEIVSKIGNFRDDCFPCSDYDFWIRLSDSVVFYKSSKILAFYRISAIQNSNRLYPAIVIKMFEIASKMDLYKRFFYRNLLHVNMFLIIEAVRIRTGNFKPVAVVFEKTLPFYGYISFLDKICKYKIIKKIIFKILEKIITITNNKLLKSANKTK